MITVKEMRALERHALSQGILPEHLMENAGKQVFLIVKEKYDLDNKHVAIFAGPGNNGGDGFVAAQHFSKECLVIVLFFGEKEKLSDEAKANFEKIEDSVTIVEIHSKEDLEKFHFQNKIELICIDALLGIGVLGEIRDPIATAIEYFNEVDGIKVAVDIPSGMNADTGEGTKVTECELIVTFHDLKCGLKNLTEKTVVADIGIPRKEISQQP